MGFYMRLLLLYKAKIYATIYVNILQTGWGGVGEIKKQEAKLAKSRFIHNKYVR